MLLNQLPQSLPIPVCIACGTEREMLCSERVTRDYAIRCYRCPKCKTDFRIAERIIQSRAKKKKTALS